MSQQASAKYFRPEKALVARKFVLLNGITYDAGDEIKDEALEEGQRRRLWVSGRLIYKDDYRPTPVAEEEPVEVAGAPTVEATHIGGGIFLVKPSWMEEGEKVKGKEAAQTRQAELLKEGPPEAIQQPDWSSFNDDPSLWDEGQRDSFDGWWSQLPEGVVLNIHHKGILEAVKIKNEEKKNPPRELTKEDIAALVTTTEMDEPAGSYQVKAAWLAEPDVLSSELQANVRVNELIEEGPPEGWEPPAPQE